MTEKIAVEQKYLDFRFETVALFTICNKRENLRTRYVILINYLFISISRAMEGAIYYLPSVHRIDYYESSSLTDRCYS